MPECHILIFRYSFLIPLNKYSLGFKVNLNYWIEALNEAKWRKKRFKPMKSQTDSHTKEVRLQKVAQEKGTTVLKVKYLSGWVIYQ